MDQLLKTPGEKAYEILAQGYQNTKYIPKVFSAYDPLFYSIEYLPFFKPYFSAKNLKLKLYGYFILLILLLVFYGGEIALIFCLIFNAISAITKIYLVFLSTKNLNSNFKIYDLPSYTILIPVYKESDKSESIKIMLQNIIFPREKLNIKILLEADDYKTINAFKKTEFIDKIDFIVIPKSFPRSKPKAMNYALNFVDTEYLVVYDAEDIPDPMQLLKACHEFDVIGSEYACLQARLDFFNRDESLITKLLSIEYEMWFGILLPGLESGGFAIPLGGTSNHFKVDVLRKLYGWDAFNVTEDADLGLRIYNLGYKTKILNSLTLEEGITDFRSWIKQRKRWIKGFFKTFFVHLKHITKYSILINFTVLNFIGFSTINFLLFPISLYLYIFANDLLQDIADYIFGVNICYIYFISALVAYRRKSIILVTFLMPFYFILHYISAYLALLELIQNPFIWNKTKHGNSKYKITDMH